MDIESVLLARGGLATTAELLTVTTRKRLAGFIKAGRLIRVCHGVYALDEPDIVGKLAAFDLVAGQPIVACMGTAAAVKKSHGAPTNRRTAATGRGSIGDSARVDGDRSRSDAPAIARFGDT